MNISLSISHDATTGKWTQVEYGYETAKSWVRTCAENQMWCMIQPSSGGFSRFSDFDMSVYEEFYRDYPNFIGFNYAEQFWGFDDTYSVSWTQRVAHWVDLMKLNQKYGGYLVVSWCGAYYGANINPIAMMKRNPAFAAICKQSPENFILCEKYTSKYGFSDIESTCLGTYLSGYSGQYGIRFDQSGWSGADGDVNAAFPVPAGAAPVIEHAMLTGETVMDGPELIWQQCIQSLSNGTTPDGYTTRQWGLFPQFNNISIDIFRKILDGTIRIMSRKEVIDRTKLVIINNVSSGSDTSVYSTPMSLFDGLYKMDGDGQLLNNRTWFKKTGRYPAIPMVYQLGDADAQSFQVQVNKSAYSTRWPSTTAKVNEFNSLFSQEYTGDLYAGRNENGWVTYNPYKTGQTASASIPFKYNTCDHMDLTYSQYTVGVIKEYSDKLTFYLTNYDNANTDLKTDIIKIYGSSSEPGYSFTDRADHQASTITTSWTGGVFTLNVTHNGPLDITVNCSGKATSRLTSYQTAILVSPDIPPVYTGLRQYEAENFDYRNIAKDVTNGIGSGISNYTAQGFLEFGTNSAASIRDTVIVLKSGTYMLNIKYSVTGGNVKTIDLYVNGTKVSTPNFFRTASNSEWGINTQKVELNAGDNVIAFTANSTGANDIYFDNVVIGPETYYNFSNDGATISASTPPAEYVTLRSGSAGVVSYTDANNVTSNCIKAYSAGSTNGTAVADLDRFPQASGYSVTWKEYYGTTGGTKGMLLRASGDNGSCSYADGMMLGYLFTVTNNADNTLTLKAYVANAAGITEKAEFTSTFTVDANVPCWYRATASGNNLMFECSDDSVTWEGGTTTTFNDNTYPTGSTELVWGLNSNNFTWLMDNITYLSGAISSSKGIISGLAYIEDAGPSSSQAVRITGNSLIDGIEVTAPENFEVSLGSDSVFKPSLSLAKNGDTVGITIYVRLKAGLQAGAYTGGLTLTSKGVSPDTVILSGAVLSDWKYDFTNDLPATSAGTPPAINITIGSGNGATAGVVSYGFTSGETSNCFRAYSGGERNGTGVADLGLFPTDSANYSITWKEAIGSAGKDYKVGVLLRGSNPSNSS
jgi:hypothetical protein